MFCGGFIPEPFTVIWDWKLTNIWRMPLSTRLYLFVSWTHSIKKIIHYGKSWLKVGLFSHLIKIQHYTESIVQYFCETCIHCRQKTNCSVALASYSPFLSSDYKIYWRTINVLENCGFTWSLTLFCGRGRDTMTDQGDLGVKRFPWPEALVPQSLSCPRMETMEQLIPAINFMGSWAFWALNKIFMI